ncbi:MAG: B12-binding domain-containing radical SAM protein, partial [Elusimicrobia bacterium]|nr:B12-binding domain-containing radical SAM protein [Elusimicrobiota bacterium]
MKILLISPFNSFEKWNHGGLTFPQLALDIIKGLTPPEHQVKIVEEEFEDVNLDESCDLVGITCMTSTAPRAYYLAEEFRKRKKKVVLGGIHPSV